MAKNYMVLPDMVGYLILIIVIVSLGVSSYTLYEIKKATQPAGITINQFLGKLTAHEELANYKDIPPLNIIRIDNTNLGNLQAQINGLDASFIGSYIVQYTDMMFIYNFETDKILGTVPLETQQSSQLPQDFFTKLSQHPELEGLEQTQPQGGIIDQDSLQALKQQLPDVYKDAKAGDYLLRYADILIIYDYQQDKIVNAVSLQ